MTVEAVTGAVLRRMSGGCRRVRGCLAIIRGYLVHHFHPLTVVVLVMRPVPIRCRLSLDAAPLRDHLSFLRPSFGIQRNRMRTPDYLVGYVDF